MRQSSSEQKKDFLRMKKIVRRNGSFVLFLRPFSNDIIKRRLTLQMFGASYIYRH